MGLTNSQKARIVKIAKQGGFQGDYTELFRQAEQDKIFETPEVKPYKSNEHLKDGFKIDPKSLLIDKTPTRFNTNPNFHTSSHTMEPNSRAIVRFLMDEQYKPLVKPQYNPTQPPPKQMPHGGFHPEGDSAYYTEDNPQPNFPIMPQVIEKPQKPLGQPKKGENNFFRNVFKQGPIDAYQESGLDDWSHIEDWDEAYNNAKRWSVAHNKKDYEFTWTNPDTGHKGHYNIKYAGTPDQELGTYGINDNYGNIIHPQASDSYTVNKYNWFEDSRYPPSHIAAYKTSDPDIFIDWADFQKGSVASTYGKGFTNKDRKQKGSQTMVFNVDQEQFLKTHLKLQALSDEELEEEGLLGGTIYKTSKGDTIKTWADFHKAIQEGDIEGHEAYNFLRHNCSDVTKEGFALDMNGNKVAKVLGLVDSPAKVLDAIKLGFPTLDVSGRDKDAYYHLYKKANDYLKAGEFEEVLKLSWPLVNGNDRKRSIGYIQEALIGAGYKLPKSTTKYGDVDQTWGPETKSALEKWEKDSGYWQRTEKIKMHEGGIGKPGDIGYIPPHTHAEGYSHTEGRYGHPEISNTSDLTSAEYMLGLNNGYSGVQSSLIAKGYKVEETGSMDNQTKNAILQYSNENLSHLPVIDKNWKWDGIGCSGHSCSEQATDMIHLLYDGIVDTDVEAGAAHSWYRQGYMLDHGGQTIWSQQGIGTYTKEGVIVGSKEGPQLHNFPPMDIWDKVMVGDVVHLGDGKYDMDNMSQSSRSTTNPGGAYYESGNTGVGHTGIIIGRDPNTGIPLIMHGNSGKMSIERIDRIDWVGNTEREDTEDPRFRQEYFIQGITRPPGLVNNPDAVPNYNALAPFVESGDEYDIYSFEFSEDYLNTLSSDQQEYANFFADYLGGWNHFGLDNYITEDEFDKRKNSSGRYGVFKNYEEYMDAYNKVEEGYYYGYVRDGGTKFDPHSANKNGQPTKIFNSTNDMDGIKANSPIRKLSNITMMSEKEIANAAQIVYGIYMTETGDPGMLGSSQKGMLMNWAKDTLPTYLNAQLKAYSEFDLFIDAEDWETAKSPKSEGALRIKVPYQIMDADNKLTQLGRWYEKAGLIHQDHEGNWISNLDAGDDILAGMPGKRGLANSIDAGILLFLKNKQDLRMDPRFDAETNTLDGVPVDYIAASMHMNPNIDREIYNSGKSSLGWMKLGDRNYSNNVVTHAAHMQSNLTETKTTYSDYEHTVHESKTTSNNHAKQDWIYMADKTTSVMDDIYNISLDDKDGYASLFLTNNIALKQLNTHLDDLIDKGVTQAKNFKDRIEYAIKLKKDNPGYSDKKIMELTDEHYQVVRVSK